MIPVSDGLTKKLEKLFLDLNFTHSLTTDIFNFNSRGAPRDGKIVTGCMVVNKFHSEQVTDLRNNDAKVFSELFSKKESILLAGEKQPETEGEKTNDEKRRHGGTEDDKTEEGRTEDERPENDNRIVTLDDCINFKCEMQRQFKKTEKISAIGKS